MEFQKVLEERHSVRKFKSQEIPEQDLQKLYKMINSAPSAGNLQCFKVFTAKEPVKKKLIAEACFGQSFIAQASVVLVFCAEVQASKRKYGEKGEKVYAVQDASIAASYAQLSAVELGFGSCWVGAFEEKKLQEILKTELLPIAVIPLGFAGEKPNATNRKPLEKIIEKI